jgi:hypothetical protein
MPPGFLAHLSRKKQTLSVEEWGRGNREIVKTKLDDPIATTFSSWNE